MFLFLISKSQLATIKRMLSRNSLNAYIVSTNFTGSEMLNEYGRHTIESNLQITNRQ